MTSIMLQLPLLKFDSIITFREVVFQYEYIISTSVGPLELVSVCFVFCFKLKGYYDRNLSLKFGMTRDV